MTKSRQGKVIQMMSPENYIRQRARTLPLHECLVNTGWEDSHMANVLISRKHSNGYITACLYLVDLFCQGVKDTTWFFNIPYFEYKDIIDDIRDQMDIDHIKYELAHNIIFAAIEFAEEYGFYPHKDFSSVTSFMLEEDTDEIELIDIECGLNGKPAYIRTPNHSEREASMIISKLEKNPGAGNYIFMVETDDATDENGIPDSGI
jgi:hypothetical protein